MSLEAESENARSSSTRHHASTLLLVAGVVGIIALCAQNGLFRTGTSTPAPAATSQPAAPR